MTKIKLKMFDKIRAVFEGTDKILVDRTDKHYHIKIQQLEEKTNVIDSFNDFNQNNFENITKTINKKINLKNSK